MTLKGAWRMVTVDDKVPVDCNNDILLPTTSNNNSLEIWPLILTKALLKIAALEFVFEGGGLA